MTGRLVGLVEKAIKREGPPLLPRSGRA